MTSLQRSFTTAVATSVVPTSTTAAGHHQVLSASMLGKTGSNFWSSRFNNNAKAAASGPKLDSPEPRKPAVQGFAAGNLDVDTFSSAVQVMHSITDRLQLLVEEHEAVTKQLEVQADRALQAPKDAETQGQPEPDPVGESPSGFGTTPSEHEPQERLNVPVNHSPAASSRELDGISKTLSDNPNKDGAANSACLQAAPGCLKKDGMQRAKTVTGAATLTFKNSTVSEAEGSHRGSMVDFAPQATLRDQVKVAKSWAEKGRSTLLDSFHKPVFADLSALKDEVRRAIEQPEYNVANLYKEDSWATRVATSQSFEQMQLAVIFCNALWIAIDTDQNKEAFLLDSAWGFVFMELAFFLFFTFEWAVRLVAFDSKLQGLKDRWFAFDTLLLIIMFIDTGLLQLIVFPTLRQTSQATNSSSLGSTSILKVVRLVRLTRMARMARVFSALPELMILIKGISVAAVPVFFTLVLLTFCIYTFGLIFVQATADTELGQKYFPSVDQAMLTLLLECMMPDLKEFYRDIAKEHWFLIMMVSVFILLATYTVMNMLIGVLVEVVKVVSAVEKEGLLVSNVKTQLFSMLENEGIEADYSRPISQEEFEGLMLQPQAARIIQALGVDIMGLVDISEFIFADGRELTFVDFMEMILELRGTNSATVKDVVELRKWMMQEFDNLREANSTDSSTKPVQFAPRASVRIFGHHVHHQVPTPHQPLNPQNVPRPPTSPQLLSIQDDMSSFRISQGSEASHGTGLPGIPH